MTMRLVATLAASYAIGSLPFAFMIVRVVTGEDITEHGTGNVGSMNVRRTTGSWAWFSLAVLGDGLKGLVPVLIAKGVVAGSTLSGLLAPAAFMGTAGIGLSSAALLPQAAVVGSVIGHNYSIWMALIKGRFRRTGKGLATGGGALLAYDWRYFLVVLAVGLLMIAVTRYMMAGQVAAAVTLPITALALQGPDWPFALLLGFVVYVAHHKRFIGMLKGREPKSYVEDRMGPRG